MFYTQLRESLIMLLLSLGILFLLGDATDAVLITLITYQPDRPLSTPVVNLTRERTSGKRERKRERERERKR